jgi:hypothetical protein
MLAVSFSGRVLVVQEVLRTVIIAPYRKAILVLCRFCRCVVGTYELQPKKSVAIHIRGNNKQCETTNEKLNMGNITMPEVKQATHLGIIRTTTMKHNIQTNVDENITKARHSA